MWMTKAPIPPIYGNFRLCISRPETKRDRPETKREILLITLRVHNRFIC